MPGGYDMFYIIHLDPPYWDVLRTEKKEPHPDELEADYPTIAAGELLCVADEQMDQIANRYPNKVSSDKLRAFRDLERQGSTVIDPNLHPEWLNREGRTGT